MRVLLKTLADKPFIPLMCGFRRLHLVSTAFMAFSHDSNDAQKTLGVVTLALVSGYFLPKSAPVPEAEFPAGSK